MRESNVFPVCAITGCDNEATIIQGSDLLCAYHSTLKIKQTSDGVVYRRMTCPNDHSWDAYGDLLQWGDEEVFQPDDPMIFKCPTCRMTARDLNGEPPERLA